MKIAIIGAGAVGLFLAATCQKKGQSVTVFTRTQASATLINQEGITLEGHMSSNIRVQAKHELNKEETFDLIIVAVKSYHVKIVLEQFEPLQKRAGSWLFVQNGMSHLQTLKKIDSPVYLGVVEYGLFKRDHRSLIDVRGLGQMKIATFKVENEDSHKVLDSIFNQSELKVVWVKAYKKMVEDKLIVNVCINPLTAILDVRNGELRNNPVYQKQMYAYFLEVMTVLKREDKEKMWKHVLEVCLKTAANESSMLVDLKRGRKLEIDSIVGYVLKRGAESLINTPKLRVAYEQLSSEST